MPTGKPRFAFTRTEFAIVFSVIAVLIAVLLPSVQQTREAARRTQSKNNLKQIGLAIHNYESTFSCFPPGGVFNEAGTAFHGWSTFILPYIDASPLYSYFHFEKPWDDPIHLERFQIYYFSYHNPSLASLITPDGLAVTHYAGSDLVFYRNSSTRISDLTNGTANTFFGGDARGDFEPWGSPYNWRDVTLGLNQVDPGFGCKVRDVTQMLMADGTVRVFNHKTDGQVFSSLRGVNARWEETPPDTTKPPHPARISPPVISLWADTKLSSSLLGVQDDNQQIVRAWFCNSQGRWDQAPRILDRQADLLRSHTSLQELNCRSAFSERGLRVLKELPALKSLTLDGAKLTSQGVRELMACPQLTHLSLDRPRLQDADWQLLEKFPRLESIRISFRRDDVPTFSPHAIWKFHQLRPECEIEIGSGDLSSVWRWSELLNPIPMQTIQELALSDKGWPKFAHRDMR